MVKKDTQRTIDRRKTMRYTKTIESHFSSVLKSTPFCNRCHKTYSLKELEINHITYDEFWRFAELVCSSCHKAIDTFKTLPKFEEIRKIPPQTILAFQKELAGIIIVSRFCNGKLILTSRVRIPKNTTVNPRLPMSFI